MRADSHYVDHLESRRSAPAIRLIRRDIDAAAGASAVPPAALVESVATHGILQPLLVRRQNGRYQVIAGRERLAAALAANIPMCRASRRRRQAEAQALSEADNLRASVPD